MGKSQECGIHVEYFVIQKSKPYQCRFIDTTTTTSPWRECYAAGHAMARRESKVWKMKLLDLFKSNYSLVVGSEKGHEAAVPYLHYFEGMMSIGPYRGRNIFDTLYTVPPLVQQSQLSTSTLGTCLS